MLSCKNRSVSLGKHKMPREQMPQEFDGNKIQIDVLLHRQKKITLDPLPWTSPHPHAHGSFKNVGFSNPSLLCWNFQLGK